MKNKNIKMDDLELNILIKILKQYNSNVDWNKFFLNNTHLSYQKLLNLIVPMCWIDSSEEKEECTDVFMEDRDYFPLILSPLNKYGQQINYTIFVLSKIDFQESILIINPVYKSELHKIHFEILKETFEDVYRLIFKKDLEVVYINDIEKISKTTKHKIYLNNVNDNSIVPFRLSIDFNEFCEELWFRLNRTSEDMKYYSIDDF